MKKRIKKNILPKEDHEKLLQIKKALIDIKKTLNEAKKEAERLDKIKKEEDSILIFQKD
jgi:hypothetical protein